MILFIKHVEVEGPEVLGAFFMKQGFRILVSNLHEGDRLPAHPNGLDAVISLGGPMNVYEEGAYPFLKEEDAFLKECLERGVPVLGICLGSQLLTKAAGGWVVQSPEPEVGWFPVDLTGAGKNDPLFSGFPSRFEVFQWHQDMCDLPEGSVLLASSPGCPVQAFRVGERAYGLQFHAEITGKSIEEWSAAYAPEDALGRQVMLRHYQRVRSVFDGYGQTLCENFLRIVKGK